VCPPCKRETWGASPQAGSKSWRVKQAGSCTRLLTDGCRQFGMAFEWSALRQSGGSHVACLVGLNPTMIRKGRERSTRSASAKLEGEVRGAHPRLESERHPHGCVDRDLPPSANSVRSVFGRGRGSGSRQASKSCAVGFDSANWPPNHFRSDSLSARRNYSGVGCWHPSCALNAAHAGPIPAA